jgi:hypothetical protein
MIDNVVVFLVQTPKSGRFELDLILLLFGTGVVLVETSGGE